MTRRCPSSLRITLARLPRIAARRARLLRRDDEGSMIIFALFIMMMMLMVGGLAVDLMRFETKRAWMQSTLDRAVLAAADLQQSLDPEAVVRDRFAKAGLADELQDVTITQGFNSKTVTATAAMDVNMMFMRMLGIDTLTAPAAGSATESVTDIEIGLVLDVSGSMGQNNRLTRLKAAGDEFIDTIFDSVDANHVGISLVPYSTQVNLGPVLSLLYGVVPGHTYSYCVDLPANTYTQTAMPLVGLMQAGHFDPDSSTGTYSNMSANKPNCRTDAAFQVLPWSNSRAVLKNRIQQLTAGGWTSIEMGVNWGAALLDPSARPVIHGLITQGNVNPLFEGRPLSFLEPAAMKVLVVMTDGENTRHYEIAPPYRLGASDVTRSLTGEYFVASPEVNNRDGDLIPNELFFRPQPKNWNMTQTGLPMTWPQLFDRISVQDHARHFRYNQYNSSATRSFWDNIITRTDTAVKDARLKQICDASKAKGIIIFSIGFEVTDRAADVMAECASSPSHFYRVEGIEISTAFNSIANQINALRLVQ